LKLLNVHSRTNDPTKGIENVAGCSVGHEQVGSGIHTMRLIYPTSERGEEQVSLLNDTSVTTGCSRNSDHVVKCNKIFI